ncbi:hypothetical protein ACXX82_01040 [Glaciimonas sp. GNP009]|uniref:hypothetical protein n=1 Tax=Glaciimonas sp. Cout2 TaxID=3048621 RepID=UPI002B238FD3|nr:hypothetical protein [Glaciimonas sp. Cout2]MEB0014536.1 hypothetical protein [Glaciimonas sp. Cout2]
MRPATLLLTAIISLFSALPFTAYAQGTFPTIDQATQKTRDDTRHQILKIELATEIKAFESTKQSLTDATNTKQPLTKLDALRQEADRHTKNLNALYVELAAFDKPLVSSKTSLPVRLQARTKNNLVSDTAQPAPFWDVYKRAQVKADGESQASLWLRHSDENQLIN